MSASSISTLPSLALLTIFDELPLSSLLRIDEVCRDWGGQLKSAALVRRKQLIIVHDKEDLEQLEIPPFSKCKLFRLVKEDDGSPFRLLRTGHDHHALTIKNPLTWPTMAKLAEMMPNLTVLRIVQKDYSVSMLLSIGSLLDCYRHQLVELTLNVCFDVINQKDRDGELTIQTANDFFISFFQSLNNLTALTSLELSMSDGVSHLYIPTLLSKIDVPDLSPIIRRVNFLHLKLDCFAMKSYEEREWETQFLPPIVANDHLEALYCSNIDRKELSKIINEGTFSLRRSRAAVALQSKDLYLGSKIEYNEANILETLVMQYPNLLELNILISSHLSISQSVQFLAPLVAFQNLVHLKITSPYCLYGLQLVENPPPVLPSVKVLSIEFTPNSHNDFEQMKLATIFPNVQVIDLLQRFKICNDCDSLNFGGMSRFRNWHRYSKEKRIPFYRLIFCCFRKSRLYFAQFSKLTKLEVVYNVPYFVKLFSFLDFDRRWSFTRDSLGEETLLPFLPREALNSGDELNDESNDGSLMIDGDNEQ